MWRDNTTGSPVEIEVHGEGVDVSDEGDTEGGWWITIHGSDGQVLFEAHTVDEVDIDYLESVIGDL